MTNDMLTTALLYGLPLNFCDFKEKYNQIRLTKPNDPPNLNYLYKCLHVKEAKQTCIKEERRVKEKARKETSGNNSSSSTAYNSQLKPNYKDRSHLKCTYPSCGKTGYTKESCQTKDPSKVPRSLKDRFAVNIDSKLINGIGGTTETNLATFKDTYSRPNSLGTAPSPTLHANIANTSLQTRSVRVCRKLQGLGGASTSNLGTRESSLLKRTLGAFLVSTSYTLDTWLADTRANMHIVNDIKWFKKETFRSFNDCLIDISTANGSATLKVKGGGVV